MAAGSLFSDSVASSEYLFDPSTSRTINGRQFFKPASIPAYILTTTIGFGSGHAYLRKNNASVWLMAEMVTFAGSVILTILSIRDLTYSLIYPYDVVPYDESLLPVSAAALGFVYVGIRISELFSLFRYVDELRASDLID